MSDSGIYATTADIQYKSGANCSAISKAEGYTNVYVAMAEGAINCICRRVFAADATEFTALPAGTKAMLRDTASCLAAIYVIQYDFSSFTSRTEAEDMINILRDVAIRNLAVLRDRKNQDFLITGIS